MKSGTLRAGLIGGGVAILFSIGELITEAFPALFVLSFCILVFRLLLWLGVGYLGAMFSAPKGDTAVIGSEGARVGAMSSFIAGAIGGVLDMIVVGFGAILGISSASALPPEVSDILSDTNIDTSTFAAFDMAGSFLCCCLAGTIVAAVLGAFGGLTYSYMRGGE